jgi:hypothetical protein
MKNPPKLQNRSAHVIKLYYNLYSGNFTIDYSVLSVRQCYKIGPPMLQNFNNLYSGRAKQLL